MTFYFSLTELPGAQRLAFCLSVIQAKGATINIFCVLSDQKPVGQQWRVLASEGPVAEAQVQVQVQVQAQMQVQVHVQVQVQVCTHLQVQVQV